MTPQVHGAGKLPWSHIIVGGLTMIVAFTTTLWPSTAAADDDPVVLGHALVTMYCSDCHATEPAGESPLAIAPRFRDLHLRYDVSFLSEALVEGIVTAHPDMPEFEFDPLQAEAIVAYLKSLEPNIVPWYRRRTPAIR